MDGILDAFASFVERVSTLGWGALGVAALCHFAKLVARSRAWRNVLAEAYPETKVRWRSVFGGYAAGVGVNAILPARGGDVLRLYIVKHRIEGATYATLGASLLVEALFDTLASSALILWALAIGALPGLDVLPDLPSIDWLWLFQHPRLAAVVGAALLVALAVFLVLGRRKWRGFRARAAQGLVILRRPRRYARRVLTWQLLDWTLRIATIYFALRAFHLVPSVHNALLVQVTHSLSTLLPLTPGGLGTEQALLGYVFRGAAALGDVLSFSVGLRVVLTVVNVVVGFTAIALMLRTFRWRRHLDRAEVPTEAG